MMKGKLIIAPLVLISLIVACGPHIPQEKMAQINELESMLDSADQRIHAIDSSLTFAMIDTFENRLSFFQNELKDTLPREEAFLIDDWYRMRKGIRKFAMSYQAINIELRLSKQQMKDLRFDAENSLVEEKHFDEYITLERENIETVSAAAHDMMTTIEKVILLYQEKVPKVDSLYQYYKEEQMSVE